MATRGLHRYVRHPLYSALFLCLWGLVQDPLSLATALWGSLYTLIGTYFEERKLISLYGEAYQTIQAPGAGLLSLERPGGLARRGDLLLRPGQGEGHGDHRDDGGDQNGGRGAAAAPPQYCWAMTKTVAGHRHGRDHRAPAPP